MAGKWGLVSYMRRHGIEMDTEIPNFNNGYPEIKGTTLANLLNGGGIPLINARVHDAVETIISTAGTDDLGLVTGSFGTTAPTIETGDVKAAGCTRYARLQVPMQVVNGAFNSAKLRINAGMKTTIADGTATLDVEVYRVGAPTVDICATAAQDINSLVAANFDFTLTDDDLAVGDILDIRVKVVIEDTSTGTVVIGKINSLELILT